MECIFCRQESIGIMTLFLIDKETKEETKHSVPLCIYHYKKFDTMDKGEAIRAICEYIFERKIH